MQIRALSAAATACSASVSRTAILASFFRLAADAAGKYQSLQYATPTGEAYAEENSVELHYSKETEQGKEAGTFPLRGRIDGVAWRQTVVANRIQSVVSSLPVPF